MATIAHINTRTSSVDASSYSTASFTSSAGLLLVTSVRLTGSVVVDSVATDSGLTFTKVAEENGTRATSIWIADQLTSAVVQILTVTCTTDAATGCSISTEAVSGMSKTGATAMRQTAKASGLAAATPAASFTASVVTTNVTYGLIANATNPPTITEPTGWTELVDTGHTTPLSGLETVGRDSGFTGNTITWGGTTATDWDCIIIELDASTSNAVGRGLTRTHKLHKRSLVG